MEAWDNVYQRIYGIHMNESSEYIIKTMRIRFEQKINSTELEFWNLYLTKRFDTSEYNEDLDLSPDPNTFQKIFARTEILKEKLEPSFSNPPLIVMQHLHMRDIPETTMRYFKSNEKLIYENEKEYLDAVSPIELVDRITTPLYIVHGVRDWRVDIKHAQLLRRELERTGKEEGKDFWWLVKSDEGHGFVGEANKLELYTELEEFFGRYLEQSS